MKRKLWIKKQDSQFLLFPHDDCGFAVSSWTGKNIYDLKVIKASLLIKQKKKDKWHLQLLMASLW